MNRFQGSGEDSRVRGRLINLMFSSYGEKLLIWDCWVRIYFCFNIIYNGGVRILITTSDPDSASYRLRIKRYVPALEGAGHECVEQVLPGGELGRLRFFRSLKGYDLLIWHKRIANPLVAAMLKRYAPPVVYDFDDAIMYDPNEPERVDSKRLKGFERIARAADRIIAGNSYLADHAREYCDKVTVLPTAVEVDKYMPGSGKAEDGKVRLVWVGSSSTLPFLVQKREVFEELGRRHDNVVLRIIADCFFELDNMAVEKVQWTEAGQYEAICGGDIGLAPTPDDRFTRGKCGFKILQYMAAGLPVVADGVGLNADIVDDGVTGFMPGDDSGWLEKISELVDNSAKREVMGRASREKVEGVYDVGIVGRRILGIVKNEE